jgi:hypothetical protein
MSKPRQAPTESRCEFCHEPILWAEWMPNPNARTRKGAQFVPINPEPSDDRRARLAMTKREGDRPLVGEMSVGQTAGFRAAGNPIYIAHAKTCTEAHALIKKLAARNSAAATSR